ncbi:MAG: hypothetical protein QM754_12495 [Tepidisphaeraceae bacterium]
MNRRRLSSLAVLGSLVAGSLVASVTSAFPEPSKTPVSWELKFQHAAPRRIVVNVPGSNVPKAYWFVTYTVTNNNDENVNFLPTFEWVTKEGKVIRSDKNIPSVVFDKIKAQTGNKLLEDAFHIAGNLRQGDDQAKDGVAIWEEPEGRLGDFQLFVTGLSGESTPLTDSAGKPVNGPQGRPLLLFKTLELDYRNAGDEVYPGNDLLQKTGQKWVMR